MPFPSSNWECFHHFKLFSFLSSLIFSITTMVSPMLSFYLIFSNADLLLCSLTSVLNDSALGFTDFNSSLSPVYSSLGFCIMFPLCLAASQTCGPSEPRWVISLSWISPFCDSFFSPTEEIPRASRLWPGRPQSLHLLHRLFRLCCREAFKSFPWLTQTNLEILSYLVFKTAFSVLAHLYKWISSRFFCY